MTNFETLTAKLCELGFSLNSTEPIGVFSDDWQAISFITEILFQGKRVWAGDYKLGIGHVDVKQPIAWFKLSGDEEALFQAWQRNPRANFKNKLLQAQVAAKLAKAQKVKPSLPDVLQSLLLDGEAYFSGEHFEDWAANYGYDPDSIKAHKVWEECDKTGRELKTNIPGKVLDEVRELLQDY